MATAITRLVACVCRIKTCSYVFLTAYGSRGKGKRRFAAQGVWRSTHSDPQSDSILWLQRPTDAPIPSTKPVKGGPLSKRHSGGGKDEVHLSEMAKEFWGTRGQSAFSSSVVEGVYSVIVKTKYVVASMCGYEMMYGTAGMPFVS